jgi:hypothetical protein
MKRNGMGREGDWEESLREVETEWTRRSNALMARLAALHAPDRRERDRERVERGKVAREHPPAKPRKCRSVRGCWKEGCLRQTCRDEACGLNPLAIRLKDGNSWNFAKDFVDDTGKRRRVLVCGWPDCNFRFPWTGDGVDARLDHMTVHRFHKGLGRPWPFECRFCCMKFLFRYRLDAHLKLGCRRAPRWRCGRYFVK